MESSDQYNFSIFRPRNLHGKKNRNVILTMLLIWATAVFGFQFLLRGIQKPTPEASLTTFESIWPSVISGESSATDYKSLLNSLVLVKGKNIVKANDQEILSDAISRIVFEITPDSIKTFLIEGIADLKSLKSQLPLAKDQEYLNIRMKIAEKNKVLADVIEPYSGFRHGSLEETILTGSLQEEYPDSFSDMTFTGLPQIMKYYLTHNQSVLTNTKFLGFPFHYFYTAIFLLILFIILCIVYNLLIEWRLEKEGVIE
jgi:hypothetical protein